jgi:hypothetical protein
LGSPRFACVGEAELFEGDSVDLEVKIPVKKRNTPFLESVLLLLAIK